MEKEFRDMNDDELDKLFRDSSEKYANQLPPEGAWDAFFQNKLNPEKETENKKGLFVIFKNTKAIGKIAAAAVLIIALGIWIGLEKNKKPLTDIAKNDNGNVHTARPEQKSGNTALSDKNVTEGNKDSAVKYGQGSNQAAGNYAYNEYNELMGNLSETSTEPQRQRLPAFGIIPINPNKGALAQNMFDKNGLVNAQAYYYDKYNIRIDSVRTNTAETNTVADLNKKPPVPFDYNDEDMERAINGDKKSTDFKDAKWQVGVVGGSNVSMVKGDVSGDPGLNTGVMVQRRINGSRFSVETGVVRESMNYALDNGDFHPNGQTVSSEVSNIQGTCTMVDVPVNVRYDVIRNKKNNAFVSTGLSTTWMANQNYNYQYTGDGGTSQVNKNVSGQGKTIYAVTNVSIGVEHHFKNTAVQIAPYVKLPLGNIGYGNMSLGSVGAQISIKQRF